MNYRILVPSGIGDFSWLWSKLSTTGDTFDVEYTDQEPERLGAFLSLLPKRKIRSFAMRKGARSYFDTRNLEMVFAGIEGKKIQRYSEMDPAGLNLIEPNTHLERGNRIEAWLPDVPNVDFHYQINGVLPFPLPQKIFIVHLSSNKVKDAWKCYDLPVWNEMIKEVADHTGWLPIFIGGPYDDFAMACCDSYMQRHPAINLIGRTPDLSTVIALTQQSKFFMGAVSSGLTMLANVLRVPSVSWWPRPGLPMSWHDISIPYLALPWKDPEGDKRQLLHWLISLI